MRSSRHTHLNGAFDKRCAHRDDPIGTWIEVLFAPILEWPHNETESTATLSAFAAATEPICPGQYQGDMASALEVKAWNGDGRPRFVTMYKIKILAAKEANPT